MADSITLTGDKHNSRYFQLVCTQESNGSAENSSTISWKLSAIGDSTYYATGPTKVIINGTTVYSLERKPWEYGKFPVAQGSVSGTHVVSHNNDGTKKITVKFSTAIYTSTVKEYSDDWTLDSIPRYATSVQSLNARTETAIKMNWSSDSTIDYLWYSKDNGSNWTGVNITDGKSGTYTISGLSANTTYKIKTRVRRKDSQLTTDSSALSVTTYDYPHCTNAPDFVIGKSVTLTFYNPLNREFDFSIAGNGQHIYNWTGNKGTTYTGNLGEPAITYLYDSIPNQKSAKYTVETVYNDVFKLTQGGTYSINESECLPTFSAFTYKDTNSAVTAVTGNNQALVKGLSTLSVEIPTANKMVAKHSASPSYYGVTIDTLSKTGTYSDTSAVTISVGKVSSAGTKRLSVRGYDSRGLSTLAYKDITVYDYNAPKISASATRLNNFEAQTTLKISGEFSRLTIGGADKNTIKTVQYRYRETGGTWTSWATCTATLSAGKITCPDITLTLENTKSFEIEINVTDNLSSGKATLTVDIGEAIFFISTNKKTCYVNGEEITTRNNVRELIGYTQLAQNTDLNSIVEPKTYRSVQASDTATMTNVPAGFNGGFTMYVYSWSGNKNSTLHRRQEIVYAGNTFIRRTLDGGVTWSDWQRVAFSNEIVNIAFPVNSVYVTATNTNPASLLGVGTWTAIDNANGKYFWKRTA